MWRRTALIVAIGLTLAARSRVEAQEHGCSDLLLSDLNWVRFDVVMGRIVAATNRAKQDRQRARRELSDGIVETLAVSIDRGLTSLQYSLESESQRLAICVVRRNEVEVRWIRLRPVEQAASMTYLQTPGEDVRVSVQTGDGVEREFHAPSLWHLMVGEPEVRGLPILDVLVSLRSDWRPLEEADSVLAALVETAPWQVTSSAAEVQLLVDQMAGPDFRARQTADRELRSRGRSILSLLDGLDQKQLDSEQKWRVREIRRALIGEHSDTPQRVAAWLVNDKRMWLALLSQADEQHRLVASGHLARIVDQPIAFDPTAAPEVRAQQVAALQAQFVRR